MRRTIPLLVAVALLPACFDLAPADLLGDPTGTYVVDLEAARSLLAEELRAESDQGGADGDGLSDEEMLALAWSSVEEYLRSISFVLSSDGTWESTQTLGKEMSSSGTWELDGKTLTLRTLIEDGVATAEDEALIYRDSRILFSDDSGQELVLVRK